MGALSEIGSVFSSVVGSVLGYQAEKERTKQVYEQIWSQDRSNAAELAIAANDTINRQRTMAIVAALTVAALGAGAAIAYKRFGVFNVPTRNGKGRFESKVNRD